MKQANDILKEALSERTASRPSYSLRAFARDLGISPQQLSNVMNGVRGLSPDLAEKVSKKLGLNEHESILFIESFRAKFSRSKVQKAIAVAKLQSLETDLETKTLELDLFKTISSWYHFALMELIKISKGKKNHVSWFARKLEISENEVMISLSRLERLELITKTDLGYSVNQDVVIADRGIPNEAIRNYHRQMMEKSIHALAFQSGDERYGSSSTIPVRVKDLARAKKLIQEFRLKFDEEISDTEGGQEIYGLSLQFFRLTQLTQE